MKHYTSRILFSFLLFGSFLSVSPTLFAKEATGNVTVESPSTPPVDPENPGTNVKPDPSPSSEGPLRIDYVSALDFGYAKIDKTGRVYDARAQLFYDDTPARGSYIQITDARKIRNGWTLYATQENQFISTDNKAAKHPELLGAKLSFTNGWANATHSASDVNIAPKVETAISLEPGVQTKIATAEKGQGEGVWTIEFGASEESSNHQKTTLYPLTDQEGKPVMDSNFNKQAYGNTAVSLSVPDSTTIYPVEYQTVITWTIGSYPN